jgi:lipase
MYRRSARAGSIHTVNDLLNVHRYGPPGPIQILAIHGLTGHGRRWASLATGHLAEFTIAAPDLLGHGHSSWNAPWTIDANVAALAGLLDADGAGPVVVVGHSFGGAIAMNLAAVRPDLIAGLVLLDPAIGLDGEWMRVLADAMLESPDYPDREEARNEKIGGSWSDVPLPDLDADLDEHLIDLPNGRLGWRISLPAMTSYWSELARAAVLPPAGIPTTLVRARWTDPPYVDDALIAAMTARLGPDLTLVDLECEHMVANAKPAECAALIRERVG